MCPHPQLTFHYPLLRDNRMALLRSQEPSRHLNCINHHNAVTRNSAAETVVRHFHPQELSCLPLLLISRNRTLLLLLLPHLFLQFPLPFEAALLPSGAEQDLPGVAGVAPLRPRAVLYPVHDVSASGAGAAVAPKPGLSLTFTRITDPPHNRSSTFIPIFCHHNYHALQHQ